MLIGIVIGLYFWFRERDKLSSVREAMGETDDATPTPDADGLPATDRLTDADPRSRRPSTSDGTRTTSPGTRPSRRWRRSASGDLVEFDCLDASNGQLTATSTTADLATLDFDAGRPGQRPGRGRRRGAGRHAPGRRRRPGAGRLGLDGRHPGLRAAGRRLPRPVLQGDGRARPDRARRVLARGPGPARAVLRRDGGRPGERAAQHDPARRPRRQHGHAPPRRRLDAVPAGLRAGRPVLDRRRPRDAGRRRGLRDGHRDADAGGRPADRAQGRPRHRPGVPGGGRPERRAPLGTALRHRRGRAGPHDGGPRRDRVG